MMLFAYFLTLSPLLLQEACVPPKLESALPPEHPLQSVYGGMVVLDALVDRGGTVQEVRVLQAQPPFAEHAIRAVRRWTFAPAETKEPVESRVSITLMFRPRRIFPIGSPTRQFSTWQLSEDNRPALPLTISDPGYPANSIAEDAVILELRIASDGTIENIRAVRDIPSLTDAVVRSVRSWRFSPSRVEGRPVAGTAIVVISFLRPVVQPRRIP